MGIDDPRLRNTIKVAKDPSSIQNSPVRDPLLQTPSYYIKYQLMATRTINLIYSFTDKVWILEFQQQE